MLSLALRKIKSETKDTDSEEEESDSGEKELEQAMADFQSATTASERAAAFKAALVLVK